jgi:cardiolipin synthase
VDVRLLLPKRSDSAIVGAASRYYFKELLQAGVRIFLYKKGFVHAKTVVADSMVSVVGTANMDMRSFDLNFEIMAVVYGADLAIKLEETFMSDLESAEEVHLDSWAAQSKMKILVCSIARLISTFL